MRKLILHIGHAKTGTSSLQTSFTHARKALEHHGVVYPRTLYSKQHGGIAGYLIDPKVAPHQIHVKAKGNNAEVRAQGKAGWDMVLEDIARVDPDIIVLSSEHLFDVGQEQRFDNFIATLRAVCDEMVVVAYLRAPAPKYLSLRQQALKGRGLVLGSRHRKWYQDALETYMALPDVTVDVQHFDRKALIGGDIVTDFATRYLSPEASRVLVNNAETVNETISPEAMAIFEAASKGTLPERYRHLNPLVNKQKSDLIRLDRTMAGFSRPTYKPGIAAFIHQHATDLDWVKQQFGFAFALPEKTSATDRLTHADLKDVRNIIKVDEQRYHALLADFSAAVALHAPRADSGQKPQMEPITLSTIKWRLRNFWRLQ